MSRIRLMKGLWDAVGTEFAGRHELYERNHFGSQEVVRLYPWITGLKSGLVDDLKRFADGCLLEYDLDGWRAPDLINSGDLGSMIEQVQGQDQWWESVAGGGLAEG